MHRSTATDAELEKLIQGGPLLLKSAWPWLSHSFRDWVCVTLGRKAWTRVHATPKEY